MSMGRNEVIEWKIEYEIGVQRIDFEHKILLDLVNSLKLAINKNCSKEWLVRIILEIEKFAEFHFISEENFMLNIGYPGYKAHQVEHFDLLEKFNLEKFNHKSIESFALFLEDWFINHTTTVDVKIKEYINSNNLNLDDCCYITNFV
jgi:hemerythrin